MVKLNQIFSTALLLYVQLAINSTTGFQIHRTPNNVVAFQKNTLRQQEQLFSQSQSTPFQLSASSTSSPSSKAVYNKVLDTEAIGKYLFAGATELGCFATCFYLLDTLQSSLSFSLPFPVTAFLFYSASLKSRVFNPLNNDRPDRKKAVEGEGSDGFGDRVMPSWTPPGVLFPIMWLLIIGPIRAYSGALVVSETSQFLNPATLAFIFHLTVGDVWNTINNTEKRYGASVVGVLGVLSSVVFAANQYYQVLPTAGKLLGATGIWLTIASALITDTWRLNVDSEGKRDVLYPAKESKDAESITKFIWYDKSD